MLYVGNRAVAVGFGRQRDGAFEDALNEISLDVISNQACSSTYGSNVIIDSTLCTSGADGVGPCLGDSGGPLDYSYEGIRYLIGVSSFVADRGCDAGLAAGFSRVTSFSTWIRVRL
ncbi:collagenase-like [Pieris napi]|uniref:collagenase-like n=1 Tax=Pieris napi TaxID=78633 RepID=UPI001FB91D63|nr:collagenase-like [Pieris napi]